jgi:hypothetical protein
LFWSAVGLIFFAYEGNVSKHRHGTGMADESKADHRLMTGLLI